MQKPLSFAIAFLALAPICPGAVTVTVGSSPTEGIFFTDIDGNLLDSTVTVGAFLSGVPNFNDVDSIRGAFTQNGSPAPFTDFSSLYPGGSGVVLNGRITDAATSLDETDPFTSPDPDAILYALIGNDPVLANATAIAVFEGPRWAPEIDVLGGALTVQIIPGNLVSGAIPIDDPYPGPLASTFASLQGFAIVPEPTACCLSLLSLLATLSLRRRR